MTEEHKNNQDETRRVSAPAEQAGSPVRKRKGIWRRVAARLALGLALLLLLTLIFWRPEIASVWDAVVTKTKSCYSRIFCDCKVKTYGDAGLHYCYFCKRCNKRHDITQYIFATDIWWDKKTCRAYGTMYKHPIPAAPRVRGVVQGTHEAW